ncbi:lysoplasmalogenase [Streptomyces sp. NBC_01500]|uniref:lysoplasmalogenase n=1 Tax=Streptomyces sp. NBC_01500 TaxID=2903886 RepID=UPI00225A220B|nr:lysoplasmalogenase [Streptomyces sp. NBC_01500]MCX4551900.1 lysoplasmalogenase [Streptomyces sp. NBC_01500]
MPEQVVPGQVPEPVAQSRAARLLLLVFVLVALVDLVAVLAHWPTAHTVAKPLLMPLLAAHAYARGAPRPLLAALLFGWGGDTLLLIDADPAFLAGMASFAAGHLCYLVLFGRRRTPPGRGSARRTGPAVAYAVALGCAIAVLWPGLPAGLRVPVAGYSLLLTAMAYRAGGLGRYAALGGALFLVSDTLIATGIASLPQLPAPDFWVMATYLAAQCLLVTGVLRCGAAPPSAYRDSRTSV